jgi:hypothetical protein
MNVKSAMKEVERREGALEKLTGEKDRLSQTIEALRNDRAAAVRDLAAGNEAKRKVIIDLEAKIVPLSLRLEGLQILFSEAEGEVTKAKGILKQAQEEEQAALAAFITERERQDREALVASAGEREKRICDLYNQLCLEVGQLQVDKWRVGGGGTEKTLEDLLATLGFKINEGIKRAGLRPLTVSGCLDGIQVWPLVHPDPEVAAGKPYDAWLNGGEIALCRREKDRAALAVEFQKMRE